MKIRRKKGLAWKFIMGIVLTGICITATVTLVGVRLHGEAITRQYNHTAYQVAKITEKLFREEELAQYADLTSRYNHGEASDAEIQQTVKSGRYQEIKKQIDSLQTYMDANDIYVFALDIELLRNFNQADYRQGKWNPVYYIIDSYHVSEQRLPFGASGKFQERFINDIITSYETGVHSDRYFVSESQFGYNTAAIYPVVQGGKTIAFIGVEIPMATLKADINIFIKRVVLMSGILAVILLLAGTTILTHTIIRPVQLVASEAAHFMQNGNAVSERLDKIHTHDEIQTLAESLLKLEINLKDYIENLTKVTAEKERIGAELNVANQIQADMLPRIFPPFPEREEFDLYASMEPAKEVGGDFYDFFMVDEDHLAIVIGDVSGKGVPAALFMVISKTIIKNYAMAAFTPDEVFTKANQELCEGNKAELFTTAWLGIYEISTGKLVFADAGHDSPILKKKDGSITYIKPSKKRLMLAGMEGVTYILNETRLEKDELLLLYTDGIPEACNEKEEFYGLSRLEQVMKRREYHEPKELVEEIKSDVVRFVGEAEPFDDMTLLALSIR